MSVRSGKKCYAIFVMELFVRPASAIKLVCYILLFLRHRFRQANSSRSSTSLQTCGAPLLEDRSAVWH